MSIQVDGIDQWREYFRTVKADIFEIIESSILVAASDCPEEFKLRRDRVAELLFSTRLTRCTQCDQVGLSVPESGESGGRAKVEFEGPGGSKESKANNMEGDQPVVHLKQMSNYSYGDAEALTDEIEEEGLILEEVLRIKELVNNFGEESDSVLFESLRKLQLMRLTVAILKATEIGKAVNGLRRHGTKQICHLARELITEWKAVVDEYMETLQGANPAGLGEATPDSVNPSVVDDEEGLPSPPMDDCAFFTTQDIDFAQFFDGMDDDGNLRNSGESNKNQEGGRRPSLVKPDVSLRKEQPPKEEVVLPKEGKIRQLNKQESAPRPSNKPMNPASGPVRPVKPNTELRVNPAQRLLKKPDGSNTLRKPAIQSEGNRRRSSEDFVQEKIEATKRRLHERYQEAEKAKRQRTIQVMELHDLPKQGLGQRKNPHNKFGNLNRKWANARR